MGLSSKQQTALRIAYLGPIGSFTWQAATGYFKKSLEFVPSTHEQIAKLVQGRVMTEAPCDFGVLPVANIVHGFIESTFRSLYDTKDVNVLGEVLLPISFCLISHETNLKNIHTVVSHEAGLAQCKKTIDRTWQSSVQPICRIPTISTSAAVQLAAQKPGYAALASNFAAELFSIPVLQAQMQDHPENTTKFWIIGSGNLEPRGGKNKTLFLVEITDGTHSLARLVQMFSSLNVGILSIKLQVIPQKSRASAWRYAYFIECEGHIEDSNVKAAYKSLRRPDWEILSGRRGRLLGSFAYHS
jgi:chorismate mutase / prephenate dehydratase